jgi:hypothetical protein
LPYAGFDLGSRFGEYDYLCSMGEIAAISDRIRATLTFFGRTQQGGFQIRPNGKINLFNPYRVLHLAPRSKYLVNPRSVGQPRDGDPDAAYTIYSPAEGRIEFRRAAYRGREEDRQRGPRGTPGLAIVCRNVIQIRRPLLSRAPLAAAAKSTPEIAFCRLISWRHRSVHGAVFNNRRKDGAMDRTMIRSIEELAESKIPALKKRYRELFGEESKSSNKQFLFRRIAFRLQANAGGDLSERARRRIGDIADDRDLRVRAPKEFVARADCGSPLIGRTGPPKDYRLPVPGTLLTRRLGDRQIVVKVLTDGFEFESRRYRSLSAIAREVTGTRWNGLLFFGLAERRDA